VAAELSFGTKLLFRPILAQRAILAEVEARLARAVDFNEAELRSQALAQAADDRRTRLGSLGERLRSYSVRL